MHPDIHLAQGAVYNPLADFRNTTRAVGIIFGHQAETPGDAQRQLRDAIGHLNGLEARTRFLDPDRQQNPNVFAELRERLGALSREARTPPGARQEATALSVQLGSLEGQVGRLQHYVANSMVYRAPRFQYNFDVPMGITPFPCESVPHQIGCPQQSPAVPQQGYRRY